MNESAKSNDLNHLVSMLRLPGTSSEVGYQIWERMCRPAVDVAASKSPRELAQLYLGFLAALLGSMSADFGHEKTIAIAREMVEYFAGVEGELEGSMTQ